MYVTLPDLLDANLVYSEQSNLLLLENTQQAVFPVVSNPSTVSLKQSINLVNSPTFLENENPQGEISGEKFSWSDEHLQGEPQIYSVTNLNISPVSEPFHLAFNCSASSCTPPGDPSCMPFTASNCSSCSSSSISPYTSLNFVPGSSAASCTACITSSCTDCSASSFPLYSSSSSTTCSPSSTVSGCTLVSTDCSTSCITACSTDAGTLCSTESSTACSTSSSQSFPVYSRPQSATDSSELTTDRSSLIPRKRRKTTRVSEDEIQEILMKLRPVPVVLKEREMKGQDKLTALIENYLINNIGYLAQNIAEAIRGTQGTVKESEGAFLSSTRDSYGSQTRAMKDPSATQIEDLTESNPIQSTAAKLQRAKKSLENAFQSCFQDWKVDVTSQPRFGLWREAEESISLADYHLDRVSCSASLPVSWMALKKSKHICTHKCDANKET